MGIFSDQQQRQPTPPLQSGSTRTRSPHIQQQQFSNNPSDAFYYPSSASSTSSNQNNQSSGSHQHYSGSNGSSAPARRPASPSMAFPREVNGHGEEISTDDGHSQGRGPSSHHSHGIDTHSHSHTAAESSNSVPTERSVRRAMSQTQPVQRQEVARMDMVAGKKVECGGCSKLIDQASGGIVVAFGKSLWHVDCFRCVKCNNRVTADTNLLLLSDGDPVCSSCSYQCYVCKLPITEEAIMTGDESYHADCFTCRQCSRRIEELVFAKTSQGIYCMTCHNERVARSRRHAEAKQRARAKKERDKERAKLAGDRPAPIISGSITMDNLRVKDGGSGGASGSIGGRTPLLDGLSSAGGASPSPSRAGFIVAGTGDRGSSSSPVIDLDQDIDPGRDERARFAGSLERGRNSPRSASSTRRRELEGLQQNPGIEIDMSYYSGNESGGSASTLGFDRSIGRSRSETGSVQDQPIGLGVGLVSGLGVPTTSRADKRRSINPETMMNYQSHQREETPSGSSSAPNSAKDLFSSRESSSPVVDTFSPSRHSPLPNSPLRASFTDAEAYGTEATGSRASSPTPRRNLSPLPGRSMPNNLGPVVGSNQSSRRDPISNHLLSETEIVTSNSAPVKSSSLDQAADDQRDDETIREKTVYLPPNRDRTNDAGGKSPSIPDYVEPPRIDAYALPSLNFSLSDPDFAKLLEGNKGSPDRPQKATSHVNETKPPSPAEQGRAPSRSRLQSTAGGRVSPVQRLTKGSGPSSLPPSPVMAHSPPLQKIMASYASDSSKMTDPPARSDSLRSLTKDHAGESQTRSHGLQGVQPLSSTETQRQPSGEAIPGLAELKIPMVETVLPVLQAVLASAPPNTSADGTVPIQKSLLEKAMNEIQALTDQVTVLRDKYSGARRISLHYIEGMTVAAEEYEKAVQARLEAETEVARLKAEVHGQTARLSLIAEDERRQESLKRQSNDLALNLSGLEKDVSKLKVERDITLAEVQELAATKADGDLPHADPVEKGATVARSLTKRLNAVKEQYKVQLQPLTMEHEMLTREITELRDTRNLYLEEAAALSAKNDELAELNSRLTKQTESMQDNLSRPRAPSAYLRPGIKHHISGSPSMSSLATTATLHEVPDEHLRQLRNGRADPVDAAPAARRFKWYKSSKGPEPSGLSNSTSRSLALPPDKSKSRPSHEPPMREHIFQPTSILRFCKCENCGDKMWGLQEVRCAVCGVYCHTKCTDKLTASCSGSHSSHMREEPSSESVHGASLFGKNLAEQAAEDGQPVPVIVTKCIDAVESQGMEYEGIYRKTGGSSLSKAITNLFERGNYDSFDLNDIDRFNDINSITSVLKSYFRALPDPLLTHALHEMFVSAAQMKEPESKFETLSSLVNQLPTEHYTTLRTLMLHLHRVKSSAAENKMNARNLGVVFGPTLMRSADSSREFADMAGKAMSIEWMIENAPAVFL